MHICFIVPGYPIPKDPTMTFIKEVVDQLVKRGVTCSVIAPQSITKALKPRVPLRKAHWIDLVDGHPVDVYQPHYFSLSNFSKTLYEKQMTRAVGRAYRRIRDRVDVVYCHFWHMGIIASRLEQEKPLFLACGESHITVTDNYASQDIDRLLGLLRGVIYVGSKAYVEASTLGLQKGAYLIAPNGYNKFFFHPMDRRECRQRLGWDQEAFILSFVGIFTTRKGADRLNRALTIINRSDEKKVYAAFIGKGEHAPTCEGIVFQGQVSHDDLCRYLNATDIFVLPTNNEGCCNSIIEALACGLPVVSSRQSFNDDILDLSCSLRIDEMNVDEIVTAIRTLRDDKGLRETLSQGALRKAQELQIENRVCRIWTFINENMGL